jgi:hypothetical protein
LLRAQERDRDDLNWGRAEPCGSHARNLRKFFSARSRNFTRLQALAF